MGSRVFCFGQAPIAGCWRIYERLAENTAGNSFAFDGRRSLVSVSDSCGAALLESLLEALAQVSFPINPQIYHDAALVYATPTAARRRCRSRWWNFPAYEDRLDEVSRAVQAYGFPPDCIHTVGMLDDIQSDQQKEPAPEGAPYVSRYRVKRRAAAV